jgi:hypothetical protein
MGQVIDNPTHKVMTYPGISKRVTFEVNYEVNYLAALKPLSPDDSTAKSALSLRNSDAS